MVERMVRGEDDDDEEIVWNVSTDVRYSSAKATGAIFIKKFNIIETDKVGLEIRVYDVISRQNLRFLHLWRHAAS